LKEARKRISKKVSVIIALLSIVGGFLVILGWFFDIEALKSVLPGMVTMKFNTAVAFLLTGVSLLTILANRSERIFRWVVLGSSLAASGIGALTCSEYILGIDLGIDQLFFKEPAGAIMTTHLGRMAASTAIDFFILNVVLLFILKKKERGIYAAQILTIVAAFLAYQAIVGYILGVNALIFLGHGFTAMALHTSCLFFLLSIGILYASGDKGFVKLLYTDFSSGMSLRRLLPIALILPAFFGWLKLRGEQSGIISNETGVSLVAILNATIFSVIIWLNARSIAKAEELQRHVEDELKKAAEEWITTFDTISDFIFILDKDSVITRANKPFLDAIKMTREDVYGKRCFEILHKSDKPWPECPHQKTLSNKRPYTEIVEDPNIGIPLLVTTSPIFEKNGNFLGSVHIAKDITQIKEADKKLNAKLHDLEVFQKVVIDRELKMIELKNKIAELEAKLRQT